MGIRNLEAFDLEASDLMGIHNLGVSDQEASNQEAFPITDLEVAYHPIADQEA